MNESQKGDSIVLESRKNLEAFEKEIADKKQRLTNICDSLKSKNQNYKKKPKKDWFSMIIDFLERKRLTYEDYDKMMFLKQDFQGLMSFAKIFNPPTWRIEEKEKDFNDFYTKNLQEVMKLDIMVTDDDLDKYIKIGFEFKARTEEEIKKKYEEQTKILNNINESLDNKEQNYEPPSQDVNGLNQIIDFLEKKVKCDPDLKSIWDVRNHMNAYENATQLYLDENPCKQEKQNLENVLSSLFTKLKSVAIDYYTPEHVLNLKKKKQEIEQKIDAYEKTIEQMKQEKIENSMHEYTDDDLRKTESKKKNETLRSEIVELKKTNSVLSQDSEKFKENNKSKAELEFLKSKIEGLEKINSVLSEEKSKENKGLKEEAELLKSQIEELKKRKTEESKESKKLKEETDLVKAELEDMKKKYNILNDELKENKKLMEETELLKSEIKGLRKENSDLNQETEKLKASTKIEIKKEPYNQEKEMTKNKLEELTKSLEAFKKKNEDLTKLNKNLATENENLKQTLNESLNERGMAEADKENQNLNLNQQDLNCIKTINKEVLKEFFKEMADKAAKLEGENKELKDKNQTFERALKIHRENLENIPKQFGLMVEKFKRGALQKIANFKKVIENSSIKYKKLKDKFQFYKRKYEQYNAAYHLMNFVGPMREFLMHDKESINFKALYDDIRDSSHLQLQFSLPEKYKHIDRAFIEEKIQISLNNIVRFNQFAKIFFNVLKKLYPEPRSNDVATKKLNESFQQIYQELQKIDNELNTGYEEMRQKYNQIKLNDGRINKNYVEIWEKCIFMESETIKRILQLDKNFESLGCFLVEYMRNYY